MGWADAVIDVLLAGLMALVGLLPEPLAEPFSYQFMQRALLTAIAVGLVCGVLSCFVVLKRWALLGDAISHAVLPGVAIAYLIGWPFFIGAFLAGALTSLGIGFIERTTRLKSDTAIGIMFTAAFALGVVIISQVATSTHLMHVLFGNVLGVDRSALLLTLGAGVVALLAVGLGFKALFAYTFDEIHARALGMNTAVIHYGLILLLTLTIVASLETVGIILVVAMLITPGATAYLLTDRLTRMIPLAGLCGVTAAVVGLYLAYYFDVASGGAMVLVSASLFLLALLLAPRHGLLPRWVRRWRAVAAG
ncbi:metal ABC transporter permease [Halorhodospira halophila]|uniref:ABC-3 protein n=1 Tax=Halorhodospira halophila (strain DSM 244 / SL1) TaxID=349124 RepID=A1WZ26_HALHL|nr:metal ABC transporter permease [Halorhodospira halophila]ABM62938.1 ABC-3 protein [Halorhodospira halophila SL1]MBK1727941.1 metal ABC transporter permease [Halorhodospira halophila]